MSPLLFDAPLPFGELSTRPPSARLAAFAAASCWSGSRWAYVSVVVVIDSWPSRRWRTNRSVPAAIIHDAWVWRRSWTRGRLVSRGASGSGVPSASVGRHAASSAGVHVVVQNRDDESCEPTVFVNSSSSGALPATSGSRTSTRSSGSDTVRRARFVLGGPTYQRRSASRFHAFVTRTVAGLADRSTSPAVSAVASPHRSPVATRVSTSGW